MIDETFEIDTDQLSLKFTRGQAGSFFVSGKTGNVEIIYPPQTDFRRLQPWLFKAVTEILRE